MTARKILDLIRDLPQARLTGDGHDTVSGISYDSRLVKPGDLFCALVGGYFDGHDYASKAVQKGAAALLVQHELPLEVPQIVVADTRAALAPVSASFFGHPSRSFDVIGITGTDGKTTTTYILESMFANAGRKVGVIGTIAVRVGNAVLDVDTRQTTPESVDVQRYFREMIIRGATTAIVEATSHGLDLHRLDCVRFATAAVTNITHEHLEYHKTIDAYRRAKARLFEAVEAAEGTAVVNADDDGACSVLPYLKNARVLTYGLERDDVDVAVNGIDLNETGSSFSLSVDGDTVQVWTPMVGRFNVANAACAVAIGLAHDISLKTVVKALAGFSGVEGRMQPVRQGQPFSVIVDYAHTPESIEKVLTLLRSLNPGGRIILVMGSAGERDPTKRPLQGAVGAKLADLCVFTTEDPRFEDPETIIAEIAAGARQAGATEGDDFVCITDRREAIHFAFSSARPGDSVLLAGKGHERSIIWQHEKRPWHEAKVAEDVLAQLGFVWNPEH